jgi:hypothetical protein
MLARKRFSGSIRWNSDTFAVDFDAWTDEDSHLAIEVQPLPTPTVFKLQQAMGRPGASLALLEISGCCSDGVTFYSNSASIQGFSFGSAQNTVKLGVQKARITSTLAKPIKDSFARLWFRGFKSFHNPPVLTQFGEVRVSGSHKIAEADEISGCVELRRANAGTPETWLSNAQDFLKFMHQGLAFAHGGKLQAPRLDVVLGDRCEVTYFAGRSFPRSLAPIHHLNQGPFIEQLVNRYSDPKPFPAMLWTAISWLHNDSSFSEARFLMAMTALETVVEHVIPTALTTVISKDEFRQVRSKLLEVVEKLKLDETSAQIFEGKLKGLNSRSLSQKIQTLRDHYGLSKALFSDTKIVALIKIRNDIVHAGAGASESALWNEELLATELLWAIVFHELGYSGPRESYIEGHRSVHPSNSQTS